MKKVVMAVAAVALIAGFAGCKKKAGDNSLAELKERGKFILGLDASFPPMGSIDDDGVIVGYDIDLGKEVAKRLGVDFVAQPINWDAKSFELDSGNIDCIWNGMTLTDERKETYACSSAYLNNDQVLVVRKESNIRSLADASGKVVAIQKGSSAQDALDDNPDFNASLKNVLKFDDNIVALQDLIVGGCDGVVLDSVVANWYISKNNAPLVVVDEILAKEEYGIAFRKGDVKLRDEVQKVLEEMEADGTVEKLCEKWFGRNISVLGKK